ncbi:hypothetical protein QQM79_14585 [Marinobacteraceae bacterium S3BR75-40.1]
MIVEKLIEKAKDIAIKMARRWADENLSYSTKALEHVDQDIRKLAADIYEYQAKFESARIAMMVERGSDYAYLTTCTKVFAVSEIKGIDELIDEVRKIGDVSADIEKRAIARNRDQIALIEKKLVDRRRTYERYNRYGNDPQMQSVVAMEIRTLSRDVAKYMKYERALDRLGDDLEEACAELIGVLKDIRNKLRKQQQGFVFFARECAEWQHMKQAKGIH